MSMDLPTRLGLWRSIAIYRCQPWRNAALRRFYRSVIRPGDLAFDIGAHVGNRSRAMLAAGARVVAVEPQQAFHAHLAATLPKGSVTLIDAALGAAPGEAELIVSRRHPTVSTLSPAWRDVVAPTRGFEAVAWDARQRVRMTTLDALVAAHGAPAFCKIDVEGHEAEVLRGLTTALPLVAVEALPAARAATLDCVAEFSRLGRYRYNGVIGERHGFVSSDWVAKESVGDLLDRLAATGKPADLYARRES